MDYNELKTQQSLLKEKVKNLTHKLYAQKLSPGYRAIIYNKKKLANKELKKISNALLALNIFRFKSFADLQAEQDQLLKKITHTPVGPQLQNLKSRYNLVKDAIANVQIAQSIVWEELEIH